MRGQAAVELFLIASLVSLVLFWLGNYVSEWQRGTVATVAVEERALAAGVARLVNRVGGTGVNVTHNLTCVRSGSQAVVYVLNASGTALTVYSVTPNASSTASLAYAANGSLTVGCTDGPTNLGGVVCLFPQGGGVQLNSGACT